MIKPEGLFTKKAFKQDMEAVTMKGDLFNVWGYKRVVPFFLTELHSIKIG